MAAQHVAELYSTERLRARLVAARRRLDTILAQRDDLDAVTREDLRAWLEELESALTAHVLRPEHVAALERRLDQYQAAQAS
jgi:truncated hemoglobin YjbI